MSQEESEEREKTTCLECLELTLKDFNLKSKETESFNIFKTLGVQFGEIRHSNFLGWLFDPNETHQQGDLFLQQFLEKIRSLKLENNSKLEEKYSFEQLKSTKVFRESMHNIDLFLVNDKLKFAICVENKIHATFSDHQLEKYHEFIEENYRSYQKIYLTLTPNKSVSHLFFECGEKYTNITYEFVRDMLCRFIDNKSMKNQDKISDALSAIKQYKSLLENDIIIDMDKVKKARKIYSNYRNEIDFIVAHKPSFSGRNREVRRYMKGGGDPFNEIDVYGNEEHPKIIRFLPKNQNLTRIFKKPEFKSWGGDYIFNLELFVWGECVYLKFAFGNIKAQKGKEELQKTKSEMFEKMKSFKSLKPGKIEDNENSDINEFLTSGFKIKAGDADAIGDYPAVAYIDLFNLEEWIQTQLSFDEVFLYRFRRLYSIVIKEWEQECLSAFKN